MRLWLFLSPLLLLLLLPTGAADANVTFPETTQDSSSLSTTQGEERNSDVVTLDLSTFKYLDIFDDQVPFAYYGGYASVDCQVTASIVECTGEKLWLVSPSGKQISAARCGQQRPVEMKLRIDENTEFGEYRCQFKGVKSAHAFELSYRFCGDMEDACLTDGHTTDGRGSCTNDEMFACLVTARGVNRCANLSNASVFNPNWCIPEANVTYCPGDHQSMCQYEAGERKERYSKSVPTTRFIANGACSDHKSTINMHLHGHSVGYGRPFTFPWAFEWVWVDCRVSGGSPKLQADCRIVAQNGTVVNAFKDADCSPGDGLNSFIKEEASRLTHNGLEILKLHCTFSEGSKVVGDISHYMVSFGLPLKVNATANKDKDDFYTRSLHCELVKKPDPPLTWDCKWTNFSVNAILSNKTSFVPEKDGLYMCVCQVSYKSCSPNKHLIAKYRSDMIHVIVGRGSRFPSGLFYAVVFFEIALILID